MKYGKKSIFHQILVINTLFSFIIIFIFGFNYLFVSQLFKEEAEKYSSQIMDNITANFLTETNRLVTLIKMCEDDPSFVMAMSNRLPFEYFTKYGMEASEKLLIMQYSLPYAEKVYAYIKNDEKFILPGYRILNKSQFIKGLSGVEQDQDFSSLENGFYTLGNKEFYVSNSYNYGTFIIQIDTAKFTGVDKVTSYLSDYEIIVQYEDDRTFATSSKKTENMIKDMDIQKDLSKYYKYNGSKYFISNKSLQNGFQIVLVEKTSTMENIQKQNNIISILVGVIMFFGCILSVFLNTRIYLPIREITKKYMLDIKKRNEIDVINGMMNQILNENKQMQDQIINSQEIRSDIELKYAIHSKKKISHLMVSHLENQYGRYRMMAIAIQSQTGGGEDLFENADDYLTDTLGCKNINVNSFHHAYIIPEEYDSDDILDILDKYFNDIKPTTMVFIGVSDLSSDFSQLYHMYDQSYERMLSNSIQLTKRYSVCAKELKTTGRKPATISFEIQNTIVKNTLKGTSKDLEEVFELIFFSDNSIILQNLISYYSQLAALLLVLLNQANNVTDITDYKTTQELTVYNPIYMYYILLEDYKRLNAGTSKEHSALRYEIIDYINQHYTETLSLESISSHFGITPVYLSSWFKKNTGINLSVYINNKRMEEAKKLLLSNKQLKISDIASQVGIAAVSTFIRQFKNYAGCTPDQYRQLK